LVSTRGYLTLLVILIVLLILVYYPERLQLPVPSSTLRGTTTATSTLPIESLTSAITTCKGTTLCFLGIVQHIVDGDTLVISNITIRLALVNAPERGEGGYAEAEDFVETLCPVGSRALVDQDDKQPIDRYNRVVAVVYCGEHNLNMELLNAGHAKILTEYCSRSEFENEAWARQFGC
jgi:endonuclease YncB( thermonuclease family)